MVLLRASLGYATRPTPVPTFNRRRHSISEPHPKFLPELISQATMHMDDARRVSWLAAEYRNRDPERRNRLKSLPSERGGEAEADGGNGIVGSSTRHFVLVHGAGHGAWCWYKVRCRLEHLGHTVTCIDLGGGGIDLNDPRKIHSFKDYHRPLCDFMSSLPQDAKVVLVGHSVGGMNVTNAIHEFGEKVEAAVYIAAMMLRNGFSGDLRAGDQDKSENDNRSANLRTSDGVLKPEYQRMLLYNLSPPEDAALASMLLRPFPGFQLQEGQFEGGPEMDEVKRVFVRTLNDKMLPLKYQDKMIDMWPTRQVFTLASDHSPFFSLPTELCDVLLNV